MSPFAYPRRLSRSILFISLAFMALVMVASLIGVSPSAEAAKPPTKTPTPSGGPTATATPGAGGSTFHVDCSAASNGNGSLASPWNNLTTVNNTTFAPGSSLLFKRATTCVGALIFQSSGTSANPITIGAYGTGAQPAIDGTGQETALKLLNTSYVTVQDLEIKNSQRWGVLATGSVTGVMTGISLKTLTVHHVTGGVLDQKWTGLIVFAPGLLGAKFDQILIDGVNAYDTTMWSGIMIWGVQVSGGGWAQQAKDDGRRSTNIIIRNSIVHDTYGDGMTIFMSNFGLMENNVVYRSGMQPPPNTIGTPNGLWYWAADGIMAQFNEAYENNSPAWDGGAFDLDYWSVDGTYQYNYAHDNSAYCVGIFGAEGDATVNSLFRYNICAANGFDTVDEGAQEVYFCTWERGSLDGVYIYNNTFYVTNAGTFGWCSGGTLKIAQGSPLIFRNNLVVSTISNVLGNGIPIVPVQRDYNLYYYTGGTFTDPSPEAHSLYNVNPLVNTLGYHGVGKPTTQWTLQAGSPAINAGINPCTGITGCTPGTRDFFGATSLPLGGAFDIGADEAQ